MLFAWPGGPVLTAGPDVRAAGKTSTRVRRQQGMDTSSRRRSTRCGRDGPTRDDGPTPDLAAWRRLRLLEAGFPDHLARALAAMPVLDLHELLQLVDRGCPPALAVRILSPLGRPGASS